jgi:hypothetical protein
MRSHARVSPQISKGDGGSGWLRMAGNLERVLSKQDRGERRRGRRGGAEGEVPVCAPDAGGETSPSPKIVREHTMLDLLAYALSIGLILLLLVYLTQSTAVKRLRVRPRGS